MEFGIDGRRKMTEFTIEQLIAIEKHFDIEAGKLATGRIVDLLVALDHLGSEESKKLSSEILKSHIDAFTEARTISAIAMVKRQEISWKMLKSEG